MNTIEFMTKEDFNLLVEILSRIEAQHATVNPVEQKEWYKSAEVKTILDCSDATLKNYRDAGKLPFTKIGGTYYYLHTDILRLFEPQLTSYQLG